MTDRNALQAAFEAAQKVAQAFDPNANDDVTNTVFDVTGLLEIYSRRPSVEAIPPAQLQTLHNLMQEAAPLLDTAEHLFKAALAGERLQAVR